MTKLGSLGEWTNSGPENHGSRSKGYFSGVALREEKRRRRRRRKKDIMKFQEKNNRSENERWLTCGEAVHHLRTAQIALSQGEIRRMRREIRRDLRNATKNNQTWRNS